MKQNGHRNKYCSLTNLENESDVEQLFVIPLLSDLGYTGDYLRTKTSIPSATIRKGRNKKAYVPDYLGYHTKTKKKPVLVIDAKHPNEPVEEGVDDAQLYASVIRRKMESPKPEQYCVGVNGRRLILKHYESDATLLAMDFLDFTDDNAKFSKLRSLIARDRIHATEAPTATTLRMSKCNLSEVNAAFAYCHQYIYRKDDISQAEGFTEFVKIIALKLMSDRRLRDAYPEIVKQDIIEVPIHDVDFSEAWIRRNEANTRNPINDLQFRAFMADMERQIRKGERKRIFEEDDQIQLKPETIRGVVRKLESIFLFGIDADLNGRLFETFLNATMRGKDLGQFFTPRSVVELGVQLAQLRVDIPDGHGTTRASTIIDACCGSGGFLIDALADMWDRIDRKRNLSATEKAQLKKKVADNNLVGIDVANAPKLARIARLNMYLHGDGGSRIFHLNALDKDLLDSDTDSPDTSKEKDELRKLIAKSDGFDVALTNPPFAKAVDRGTDEESRILNQYQIGKDDNNVDRQSIRSSLLFAERYYDFLRPGGLWVTIIDDGILSGDDYRWFRAKLREWFLIRAVISLPGDAFQRSNARVKTSYLIGEKRAKDARQEQPPVFMYPCQFVGIDDPKRQRARHGDLEARARAKEEIKALLAEYRQFADGENERFTVEAHRITDRLDVKHCLMSPGRSVNAWRKAGFMILSLSQVLQERTYTDDEIITKDETDMVRLVIVRYDGYAEAGDEVSPAETSYSRLYPVRPNDILISNIAATYGSIAIVPPDLDDCAVSSEYTILQVKTGFDPQVVRLILRSPEVRSDILLSASGANRTRVKWDLLKDIRVPYPTDRAIVKEVQKLAKDADAAKRQALRSVQAASQLVETNLLLRSKDADTILAAFKPPK